MSKRKEIISVLVSTLIIVILFHRKTLGLNLFIFEAVLFSWLVLNKHIRFSNRLHVIVWLSFIITSIATVITHSTFSYVIHFLVLIVFVGSLIYPQARSVLTSAAISLTSLVDSQFLFSEKLSKFKVKGQSLSGFIWKSRIYIIPVIIIAVFLVIYRLSNPVFDNIVGKVLNSITEGISQVFVNFDFLVLVTLFIGLLISNYVLLRIENKKISEQDEQAQDFLTQVNFDDLSSKKVSRLQNDLKSGVFLFLALNIILLVLNVTDVYWVWFNFEWNGLTLKEFVHEGTYYLLFSILISIVLVVYYFRGHINFNSKNKFIKYLCYAWIFQNFILVISVAIRNYWYIKHFLLAYKRIGVVIFLALTVYGLYSVFIKIRDKKSMNYLIKTNALALFCVLVISSLINWDTLIAKYNFNHSDSSYLDINFMASLSDKTLPYIDKPVNELEIQYKKLDTLTSSSSSSFSSSRNYFITPINYKDKIEGRKKIFKEKWNNSHFLEWNLPESLAYKKLFKNE